MGTQDEEIKLHFLVSGSYDALPSSCLKLRSYLNTYSSYLANLHGLKLPKCFTKKNLACGQCFLPWSHDSCSLKLLPNPKHSKALIKSKVNSNKDKKLQKTHLVLKCNVCLNRSHFYLPKIKKREELSIKQVEGKIEKKKKKKKKDKTCGLRKTIKTITKTCEKPETPKSNTNNIKSCREAEGSKSASPAANITISARNIQQSNSQVKNANSVAQTSAKKIPQHVKSKNVCPKISHGGKLQNKKFLKKKNQNLQKLRKIVQGQKEPVKKTLKDFLTLI